MPQSMDFLWHNPIADMPGPVFIWVAIAYCFFVAFFGRWFWLVFMDATREMPVPPIEPEPDPYEIAYLRGGTFGVAVTGAFNLVQQDILKAEGNQVSMAETEPSRLNPVDQAIYHEFNTPKPLRQVLGNKTFMGNLTSLCATYEQRLVQKKFMRPAPSLLDRACQAVPLLILMEAPLLYKLFVALAKGRHNLGFLVILIVVGPFLFRKLYLPGRLTALGTRYLAQLKTIFVDMKHTVAEQGARAEAVIMVGLFGSTILAGSSYGYFNSLIPRGGGGSGTSCGSSCGGGGCGGGCGGCGS